MRGVTGGLIILLGAAFGAIADEGKPLKPSFVYSVDPPFFEKKHSVATDLSGAACDPAGTCLAINDQSRFAQFFVIDGTRIAAGAEAPLIGKAEDPATLGTKPATEPDAPATSCLSQDAAFADLDGEGAAYAEPYFYVVGSHGCSRKHNAFIGSAFILARVRAGRDGAEPAETTYRLSDALQWNAALKPYFGVSLNEADGLNIEGLAVAGDDLVAGLRAPSIGGKAYLVRVGVSALFAPGHEPLRVAPQIIPIALGANSGIRDLAFLPDGRLLILAGPAQEQTNIPFSLFTIPWPDGTPTKIATLKDEFFTDKHGETQRAKAEGMVVLEADPLRLLIFFDGPENGAPSAYIAPN